MWPRLSAPSADWLSGGAELDGIPLPHTHPRPARGPQRAQAEEGAFPAGRLWPGALGRGLRGLGGSLLCGQRGGSRQGSLHPRKG